MEYGGKVLILDNFRDLLYDFSVDVQDVVRSSILDNIDIIPYINAYRNDAYKLDQIRLSIKEGLPKEFFKITGESLYQIRQMRKRGVDLSMIESKLAYNPSELGMKYLIKWVDDGINISKLNIAIIPNDLLETFDYGLRSGFDMSEFNNGKNYSSKYVKLCLQIKKNEKAISFLLKEEWTLDNLIILSRESRMQKNKWADLVNNIDARISTSRLELLIKLVKGGVSASRLQERTRDGKYLYDEDCLSTLLEGFYANLDLSALLQKTSSEEMRILKSQLELDKKRKISGKLVRNLV